MFRKFLNRALIVLVLAASAFTVGVYVGFEHPRAIDPQDYIETSFMPYQSGVDAYLKFLDGTKRSLRVAVYELTEPRIVDKWLELQQNGVKDIIVLLDKSQTVSRSGRYEQAQIQRLRDAGIEVVIGTSEQKHNIMHLKMSVRDGDCVEDGSYNYSKSANTQANNVNVIYSPKRAALFLTDWQRMYDFMKTQDQTPWVKAGAASAPEETQATPE